MTQLFENAMVGAASFDADHFKAQRFAQVLAVDGGYSSVVAHGLACDFALGDFDSLGFVPSDVDVEVHPVMKDDSDTALALSWAAQRGWKSAAIYGALGARLDHTMATFQAMAGAARVGMDVCAVGEGSVVVALAGPATLTLPDTCMGALSVFSVSDESQGLTERGLLYEVEGVSLTNDVTLGLSNEFVGKASSVSVEQGALLVFLPSMPLASLSISHGAPAAV